MVVTQAAMDADLEEVSASHRCGRGQRMLRLQLTPLLMLVPGVLSLTSPSKYEPAAASDRVTAQAFYALLSSSGPLRSHAGCTLVR